MESKKIYESMAAIMAGVGAIDKSQKNQTQGFMCSSAHVFTLNLISFQ